MSKDIAYLEMNPNQWVYEDLKQQWMHLEFVLNLSVSLHDIRMLCRVEDELVDMGIDVPETEQMFRSVDVALKQYEEREKAEHQM